MQTDAPLNPAPSLTERKKDVSLRIWKHPLQTEEKICHLYGRTEQTLIYRADSAGRFS